MTNSDRIATLPFNQAILRYATALSALEEADPNPSLEQVLEVLTARDAVKAARSASSQLDRDSLSKLIHLDNRLKQQAAAIASQNKLTQCRQSLEPNDSDWWWFIEPPASPPKPQPKWSQFDWIWNALTVVCLVGTATFATSTIKAFSKNGFDPLQTFATIAQGAGLALVARSTLTDKGQQGVKNALDSLSIPKYLHAEATFAASAVFLGVSYGIYAALPDLGKWYYERAEKYYEEGQFSEALNFYTEANSFTPDLPEVNVALGKTYENLGEYDEAKKYYEKALIKGNPAAFNGMGRVLLETSPNDPEAAKNAQLYFVLGLKHNPTAELKARLHANLGLALLRQHSDNSSPSEFNNRLLLAKQNLNKAIEIQQELPNTTPGWGVAYCYLVEVARSQNSASEQERYEKQCQAAKPESLREYKKIAGIGGYPLVEKIDIAGLVNETQTVSKISETQILAKDTGDRTELLTPTPSTSESNASENPPSGAALSSPLEITEPNRLEEVKNLLYKQLDETWVTYPSFQQPLVYQVKVTESGAIATYQPLDKPARDFMSEIPLSKLASSTDTQEPLAEFLVTFTPSGILEVKPIAESSQ